MRTSRHSFCNQESRADKALISGPIRKITRHSVLSLDAAGNVRAPEKERAGGNERAREREKKEYIATASQAKRRSQAVEWAGKKEEEASTLVKATRILRAPIAVLFLHHPISVDRLIARLLPTGTMLSFRSRRYISLAEGFFFFKEKKKTSVIHSFSVRDNLRASDDRISRNVSREELSPSRLSCYSALMANGLESNGARVLFRYLLDGCLNVGRIFLPFFFLFLDGKKNTSGERSYGCW